MINLELSFGNAYFNSALILVSFLIISKVFQIISKKYIKKLTKDKKPGTDEYLIRRIVNPFCIYIILFGLYIALEYVPLSPAHYTLLDNLFFIISVLILSLLISRTISLLINRWLKIQKRFEKAPRLINKIISIVIYLVAILIILDHFQIKVTPLIATLGISGLALGLALQTTLSNFFAGLYLISDRPINVGDFIKIENNLEGYIEDIGWRSTRIRTNRDTTVVVPNSKLSENIITNYSLPSPDLLFTVDCGVSYNSNLEKVEKVTVEIAKKIQKTAPGAIKNFEPYLRFHTFGESNIIFSIYLRIENFDTRNRVVHEFIKALKERYKKEKIEISYPVRKSIK